MEKAGVKLQIGFVRRFDHNHKAVHDVVANGKLGAPCVVKLHQEIQIISQWSTLEHLEESS